MKKFNKLKPSILEEIKTDDGQNLKNLLESIDDNYKKIIIEGKKFEIKYDIDVFKVIINDEIIEAKNTKDAIDLIKNSLKVDELDVLGDVNITKIYNFLKTCKIVKIDLTKISESQYFDFLLNDEITGEKISFKVDDENIIIEKNNHLLIIDNNIKIKNLVLEKLNKVENGKEMIIKCLNLKPLNKKDIYEIFDENKSNKENILNFYGRREVDNDVLFPYSIYVETKDDGIKMFMENELNEDGFFKYLTSD